VESPRFVLIPCQTCRATTVVLGEQRRPKHCARCRTPYDPTSASFRRAEGERVSPAAPGDSTNGRLER